MANWRVLRGIGGGGGPSRKEPRLDVCGSLGGPLWHWGSFVNGGEAGGCVAYWGAFVDGGEAGGCMAYLGSFVALGGPSQTEPRLGIRKEMSGNESTMERAEVSV